METTDEKVDRLLAMVAELQRARTLPTVLKRKDAARELGCSLTKLKEMLKDGRLMECETGGIPSSEVLRVAGSLKRSRTPKPRTSGGRPKVQAVRPADVKASVAAALKAERKG